ncbi:hypothetical protein K438DRAFT_1844047 [Mycena galopus ATCC 62051]|nr:hypothetical protein K438DRAFT_1844047 [Mycena galopus ATCC 62051]
MEFRSANRPPCTDTIVMSSQVDVCLLSQEDSELGPYFDKVYKAEEESLSLWPLEEAPVLYDLEELVEGVEPEWNKDPPFYTLLWRPGQNGPSRITGPIICTNLFGRTPAQAFDGFPTDFSDFDSAPSSPSLSPLSIASPSSADEANSGERRVIALPELVDDDMDEISHYFSDQMNLDSPSPPPQPILILDDDILPPPPPSPPTVSTPDLYGGGFSPSSTLVGSSNASSTCALSPSPIPFSTSSSASPAPEVCRSPRSLSPHQLPAPAQYHFADDPAVHPSYAQVAPLIQIALEEHPIGDAMRHRLSSRGPSKEEDDFKSTMDDGNARRRKKSSKPQKRYPCSIAGCTESFTRANDVTRHIRNAAIHKSAQNISRVCEQCGEELSRPDAARRHEAKGACHKRTRRLKSTYAMFPA